MSASVCVCVLLRHPLQGQDDSSMIPPLWQVLSVKKALSIQSHPDKQLAEMLHREHPKVSCAKSYPASQHTFTVL